MSRRSAVATQLSLPGNSLRSDQFRSRRAVPLTVGTYQVNVNDPRGHPVGLGLLRRQAPLSKRNAADMRPCLDSSTVGVGSQDQDMLQQAIISTVGFCIRHAAQVIGLALVLALVTGIYAANHFALDADINNLISKDLPWRKSEAKFEAYFPPKDETILAVIDAPTSELASEAAAAVVARLSEQKDLFNYVSEAGGGPFFQKNGLLFLPMQEVQETTKRLGQAKSIIAALAQDSNLRGLVSALNYGLT